MLFQKYYISQNRDSQQEKGKLNMIFLKYQKKVFIISVGRDNVARLDSFYF